MEISAKYEVAISKGHLNYLAILVCNCGEKPETRAIESPDLSKLLALTSVAIIDHDKFGA